MSLVKSKFHFIGIGGIGMCGLAEVLNSMGLEVTGSDIHPNANTDRLVKKGIKVMFGHSEKHVGDVDVVVYSSAITWNNPEITEAKLRCIPIIPRAEALSEIMRSKRGIAVAGTHGKTTTTSMVSNIFLQAKKDPTIVVGGKFANIKSTAVLGQGEWMIAEADESDGSFNKLAPEISIITNIDSDHMDHYKTFENLQKAFYDFALKVPFYGVNIVFGDDNITRNLFENFPKKIWYYGFSPKNDYWLRGEKGKYEIFFNHQKKGTQDLVGVLELEIPGRHNALNALAAIMVAIHCDIKIDDALLGIKKYQGVDRRFQYKGEKNNIKVYDDYGHHPTEVRAVLEAFKEKFPQNRLVTYFQPHRYTRTQSCWTEFINCFYLADVLILTDIYPAGEQPLPNISGKRMFDEIKIENKFYHARESNVESLFNQVLRPGDILVTLGAGDGWKVGAKFLEEL